MDRLLRGIALFGIVLVGALALVIAQHIAAERGYAFGALPSIIIAVPFLYLASKFVVPRGKEARPLTDAENLARLESIAANPKVREELRAQARQRADRLRSKIGDGSFKA